MNPRLFIEKMLDNYYLTLVYGEKPSTKAQSPLEEGDHPELDSSEFLEEIGIQQYQSLVWSLQWAITIGRWDVQTAVMTLSGLLMHDVLSGKAVTGCLHFANKTPIKTPIMWYSKKQATSETATYGAEFSAARTCIEQVVDLRQTFRYLGVPINDISYVFGDNKSMIDSAKFPYSRLNKRHNILSFHYVRSMIAKKFIAINHINSQDNVSDILSKHWSHNAVYHLLKPLFHHIGDTGLLYIDDSPGCLDHMIRRLPKEK